MAAMVVGPLQADGPEQAGDGLGPVADEPGRFVAARAAQDGPPVPPLFRSSRAVSMALAPTLWTRSRTSNSVRPKNWPAGLEANSSARERRSESTACWRD